MPHSTAVRNAAYARALIRAQKQGPYTELLFCCRTYAQRTSPDWTARFHGHRADPVDVVNGYISRAIRAGLTGEQIRCAFAESGLVMPVGVMTLGRLLTLDLTQRKDSWLRYWCNVIPRVLVCATRGELDGAELDGRVYKDSEIREVLPLCVTAQAEDLQLWSRLVAWAIDELYPEYERRKGKQHKCQQRAVECTHLYPAEW
jgi:hypothetical protein